MNENIDLTKILKDCPIGWKFYSSVYGEVEFLGVLRDYISLHEREDEWCFPNIQRQRYPIQLMTDSGEYCVSREGRHRYSVGECTFFPSREQRDWSKFTAPWYKKEESIKPKFKVGDRIRNKETNKDDVYEISKVYDDTYGIVGFTWMIYMKYQDQYELVPNKFDPKTLKPFDKVIFKGHGMWFCGLFSHIHNSYACVGETYYKCVIPYNDDTKYLVGTRDEAPYFYRYWED